ncbi:hypothetical protein IFR05_003638 [Cadophora sp. M221]|nr:hypothetical protein IFR05_003638 [Cadophora sp. M221]
MKTSFALLALPFLSSAALLPREASTTTLPAYTGTLTLPSASIIPAGGSYDGKMKRIDTGHPCELDVDLGNGDIVFILGEGATLSNVIIGPAQKKGVHCLGKCTLINVWWSKTCYYGLSVLSQKAGDKIVIRGGGAFGNTGTNVIESSGAGTVEVTNFYAQGFANLYKSNGYSATSVARHAILSDITAKNGKNLAGINSNFGDTAKITKSSLTSTTNVCTTFKGTTVKNNEAVKIGSGNDGKNCIYGSDVVSA